MDYQELELAGIEVTQLLGRLMNNTKLIKVFVAKFLEDQTYQKLCSAVESGDWEAAIFACHSLKGVCGNLSLKELFSLTDEQLRLLRAEENGAAAAMMEQITQKYHTATLHIQSWLVQQ